MKKKSLFYVSRVNIWSIAFLCVLFMALLIVPVYAETLYPWQVYDDQQLDKTVVVSSSANVEVGTSGLYSAILSDLNDNSDKPVQQFRFTAYLQLTDGAGYVNNATFRFGTSRVMYADSTPSVQLSSDTIVPVTFTVSSSADLTGSPVLRFYVTTTSGCSFKVVGMSCTAYRLVEQETAVSYDPRVYYLLVVLVALVISWMIIKLVTSLFNAIS